jgi:K+-transporting ATPase ATPase C chain
MLAHLRRAVLITVVFTALTFAYAYAGTGVAQLVFPHQANGSLTANGSTLIGQNWASTKCPGHPDGSCVFHGRPDDTGPYAAVTCTANASDCSASAGGDNPLEASSVGVAAPGGQSGATNLGPRSATLEANTEQLIKYWHSLGVDPTPDLVTTSGSGYDPDIGPADAMVQIPMVARATGISPAALTALVRRETHGAQLGFLGSSYIDVLQLNEGLRALEQAG